MSECEACGGRCPVCADGDMCISCEVRTGTPPKLETIEFTSGNTTINSDGTISITPKANQ